ncbi:MAG: fibronectin type III domain-containing protein [Candidatus Thorarchaeota archaeon]
MKPHRTAVIILSLLLTGLLASTIFSAQQPILLEANTLALGDPWGVLWMRPQNDGFAATAFTTGAVFVAGTSLDFVDAINENILLVKYSTEGEQLWNQTWSTPIDEAAYALATSNDALYLAGKTTTGAHGTNGLLVKLDFEGNKIWNVSFGNFPAEWFTSVAIGADGVYVAGILQRSSSDDADALIAKFNFDGTVLWSEAWDLTNVDRGFSIAVGTDGVYLVGDYGGLWDGLSNNAFLAKYSFTGIQVWNTTWGGGQKDLARAVTVCNESVYVSGSTQSFSTTTTGALFLLKYNSTNTMLWETIKNTGSNQEGLGIFATEDTVFVGAHYEDPVAGYRANLLNFNTTGEFNWERAWGGAGPCQPFGFTTGVNTHYFAGTTSGWLGDTTNGFLVKFGFDGETSPGPVELLPPTILNPYGTLLISWNQAFDGDGTIDGYELQMDVTPLFDIPDRTWNVNATSQLLSNHPLGTYYFRIRARDNLNILGPWSNIITVTISLVPPTLFNPWLAPMVLLLGSLILVALLLYIYIRRRRLQ